MYGEVEVLDYRRDKAGTSIKMKTKRSVTINEFSRV